jgi:leader peptidase (prepilin peptidase)/N-methyltransferase
VDLIFFSIALFLFGAVFGSFLNVCIYRLPRKESIVSPGSRCPGCGHELRWFENVPLISYAALKGKCKNCGEPISWRYPLVEFLNAALWAFAGWRFGIEPVVLPALLFISTMIIIFFIDLEYQIIPNVVVLPVAVIGLVAMVAISLTTKDPDFPVWWAFPLSGLIAAAVFLSIAVAVPKGMGMGDVKMVGMMGFFLGRSAALGIFIGVLLGSLIGIGLMVAGKKGRKSRLPLGPFLAVGALIAFFYGEAIMGPYLGLFE